MITQTFAHPVIVEDFPLDNFTKDMSIPEQQAFVKGFSKCLVTFISAIQANKKLILPNQKSTTLTHFTDLMIQGLQSEGKEASNEA